MNDLFDEVIVYASSLNAWWFDFSCVLTQQYHHPTKKCVEVVCNILDIIIKGKIESKTVATTRASWGDLDETCFYLFIYFKFRLYS